MEEKPKEEIVLNSEDEDYGDLPACGTTGDPSHKVKEVSSKKKVEKNTNKCCSTIKGDDAPTDPCPCEKEKVHSEKEETKEVDETTVKKDEDDKLIPEIMDEKKTKTVCYKCKLLPAQYKYRQEFACKGCMESNLEHKLKSNLKLRVGLERNEKVLVCISGGSNSLVMGQLVSNALYNLSGKKMFFTAELLHIDMAEIYEQDEDTTIRNQQIITAISEKLKIKLNIIQLSSIFSDNNDRKIDETEAKQNKQKLLELLSKFKGTGSCKEDLVQAMKTQLIMNYAFKQNYDKVLLGSSGQRLASKIFALFAKGRAVAADNEINYADKIEYEDLATFFNFDIKSGEGSYPKKYLIVGRPMKDFLNKDILNYTHSQELLPLVIAQNKYLCETEKSNLKLPGNGNIDWIMEDFIDNIQENFVSTTHTILHTSEKIIKKQKPFEGIASRCPLCFQYRDVINNPLETETYDSLNKEFDQMKGKDPRETTLCFGCTRIFQNRIDLKYNIFENNLLPKSIVSRAQRILDFVPAGIEEVQKQEQGNEKLENVPIS